MRGVSSSPCGMKTRSDPRPRMCARSRWGPARGERVVPQAHEAERSRKAERSGSCQVAGLRAAPSSRPCCRAVDAVGTNGQHRKLQQVPAGVQASQRDAVGVEVVGLRSKQQQRHSRRSGLIGQASCHEPASGGADKSTCRRTAASRRRLRSARPPMHGPRLRAAARFWTAATGAPATRQEARRSQGRAAAARPASPSSPTAERGPG